ncbi:MAG: RNA polymerase sigma factor [Bacillota bacterium]
MSRNGAPGAGGKMVPEAAEWLRVYRCDPARAVEQAMQRYGDYILRLAYLTLGDRHEAEDVAQETFLRALAKGGQFRGECQLGAWLGRICLNLCRDRRRTAGRTMLLADPLPAVGEDGEGGWRRVQQQRMLAMVRRLPPVYRDVVMLHYWSGYDTVEIARAMGVVPATIRSRLHRARLMLKTLLEKEGWTS